MNNLINSALFEGGLVRDPELSYTAGGTPVCHIEVSARRSAAVAGDRVTEYCRVEAVAYGDLATSCAANLERGRVVRLTGRLRTELGVTAEQPAERLVLVADHAEFMSRRVQAA